MGHDVFISHSSNDKAVADAVCAALEANGVRCWIAPRDIRPGENWASSILRGIADSRMMVLVFSEHTNGSQHIRREVERAVHRGIPIAPLRIHDVMPKDDLEYFLSSSHWMDALTPPLEKHLREFAQQVRGLLALGGDSPAAAPDLVTEAVAEALPVSSPARVAAAPRTAHAPAPAEAQPVPAPPRPGPAEAPPEPPARRRRVPARLVVLLLGALLLTGAAVAGWAFRGELARRFASAPADAPAAQGTPATPQPAPPPTPTAPVPTVARAASPVPSEAALTALPATTTNAIGMKFVRIEPGEFLMGSPANEDGRQGNETQHKVKLTKPFLMQTTPVTQAQWTAVMETSPSYFKGDGLPVEGVLWDDAVEFCRRLSKKEGKHYRLPTEAEWEYSCRAGTTTPYYTGSTEAALDKAGWYNGNSDGKTHPVGQKRPNNWGLYDMHGNVSQWCADAYAEYPAGDATDPARPGRSEQNANISSRVLRGGSWSSGPASCRAAYRYSSAPGNRGSSIGFRVALDF